MSLATAPTAPQTHTIDRGSSPGVVRCLSRVYLCFAACARDYLAGHCLCGDARLCQAECRLSVYALVPRALLARGDTLRLVLDSLALPTASSHAVRRSPSRVGCSSKIAMHAMNAVLQACGASLVASFPCRTDCGPCRRSVAPPVCAADSRVCVWRVASAACLFVCLLCSGRHSIARGCDLRGTILCGCA